MVHASVNIYMSNKYADGAISGHLTMPAEGTRVFWRKNIKKKRGRQVREFHECEKGM